MASTHALPNFRIAVVGAGAVGCYYGGKLANCGCDVHFLMRSDLGVVKKKGLTIRSNDGDIHLAKLDCHGSTAEIGPCDLVLIALKATSNDALDTLIPPLLKSDTMLLTLQNGLGNEEYLAGRFGAGRVLGGLCFVCLNRVAPGVIEHYGHGKLSIGEFMGHPLSRTHDVVAEFKRCEVIANVVENLLTERWRKLVWNIPFNGLAIAAGNVTVGDILADEELTHLTRRLMLEVIGIAQKCGHEIPTSFADHQIDRSRSMGAYKPSSLIDYMAGRAVEVEAIWGEPWRRGLNAGAEVGRLEMLYHLLKRLTSQTAPLSSGSGHPTEPRP